MESQIIKGKAIAKEIRLKLKKEFDMFLENNITLKVAVIYFGSDPSAESYIKSKEKTFSKVGVEIEKFNFDLDVEFTDVKDKIELLNNNDDFVGIMIEMPIPEHIDKFKLFNLLNPGKDIDCLTPFNYGKLFLNDEIVVPATAAAVLEILKQTGIEIKGKNITIIGRSNIVGKPLAILLIKEHATITVCHTKTKNVKEHSRNADILITSAGKANLVNSDYITANSIVIDVGINFFEGKLCGDVNYNDVLNKVKMITPVPGGVGPVTSACLLKNLLNLLKDKMK
ncbi:bifunctional methylenetetrahydrofolate dehydrogenase/methenyltetrahydrofolate cyclohydrolase [Candidatus Dependentiae bacterium]|nr:bifunctional methylenetetrahydrofolate dehydrogenase/methenyltetrahydrofolate cyclohydrolase [Candidatus Dependentiae bacterium]